MDDNQFSTVYEMVKDTNKRVRKLESRARRATVMSIIKWIVYIAIAVGSYYYIQPYINSLKEMYAQVQETTTNINGFNENASQNISELLERFKSQAPAE